MDASDNTGYVGTLRPWWGNAACCGYPFCLCGVFTRCGILSLLLGLLLGALITGLVVGLTLHAEIVGKPLALMNVGDKERGYGPSLRKATAPEIAICVPKQNNCLVCVPYPITIGRISTEDV